MNAEGFLFAPGDFAQDVDGNKVEIRIRIRQSGMRRYNVLNHSTGAYKVVDEIALSAPKPEPQQEESFWQFCLRGGRVGKLFFFGIHLFWLAVITGSAAFKWWEPTWIPVVAAALTLGGTWRWMWLNYKKRVV